MGYMCQFLTFCQRSEDLMKFRLSIGLLLCLAYSDVPLCEAAEAGKASADYFDPKYLIGAYNVLAKSLGKSDKHSYEEWADLMDVFLRSTSESQHVTKDDAELLKKYAEGTKKAKETPSKGSGLEDGFWGAAHVLKSLWEYSTSPDRKFQDWLEGLMSEGGDDLFEALKNRFKESINDKVKSKTESYKEETSEVYEGNKATKTSKNVKKNKGRKKKEMVWEDVEKYIGGDCRVACIGGKPCGHVCIPLHQSCWTDEGEACRHPSNAALDKPCCRYCKKGKPCGKSCISRKKECRKKVMCACDARNIVGWHDDL